MKHSQHLVIVAIATVALLSAGCAKKKVAAQAPPPPTPPAAPAAQVQPTPAPTRTVTPTAPAPAPAPQATSRMPDEKTKAHIGEILSRIEDAYFDYDRHTLRPDAIKALEADSTELRDILKDYPDYKLTIEGHCDERGSAEYNMGLGQERADAAKAYLVQVGIPSTQLSTVSYGKEKPVCDTADEACWQRNRRIHIVADSQR